MMIKIEKSDFGTDYFIEQNERAGDMYTTLVTQNIPHRLAEFWATQNFDYSRLDIAKKIWILSLYRFENPLDFWL
ncbi:MAG: hypothetical protein AAB794_04200 [Patescibacteria group bacterium]